MRKRPINYKYNYRISSYSCHSNYSFLEAGVRQVITGGKNLREETIIFEFENCRNFNYLVAKNFNFLPNKPRKLFKGGNYMRKCGTLILHTYIVGLVNDVQGKDFFGEKGR